MNVKKAIEIVNKFEMIPPSGATSSKGLTGGMKPTGYSSANEGAKGAPLARQSSADINRGGTPTS